MKTTFRAGPTIRRTRPNHPPAASGRQQTWPPGQNRFVARSAAVVVDQLELPRPGEHCPPKSTKTARRGNQSKSHPPDPARPVIPTAARPSACRCFGPAGGVPGQRQRVPKSSDRTIIRVVTKKCQIRESGCWPLISRRKHPVPPGHSSSERSSGAHLKANLKTSYVSHSTARSPRPAAAGRSIRPGFSVA